MRGLPYELDSVVIATTEEGVFLSFKFPVGSFWTGRIVARDVEAWVKDFLKDQDIDLEKFDLGEKSE